MTRAYESDLERAVPDTALDIEPDVHAPTTTDLNIVRSLAARQLTLQRAIEDAELVLKNLQADLRQVREVSLPAAMADAGMSSFSLTNGAKIQVKEMVVGSVAAADRGKMHEWLDAHGFGALIKHEIKVLFGRDEESWAKKFLRDLAKRKKPLKFDRKDAVAPQTLQAFIREQVARARAENLNPELVIPHDLFGIYTLRYAEIVDPKPKDSESL